MKSSLIRQKFLDFFTSKQHTVVASSSLLPNNDPTLLFTNAGMVQFKDVFLGLDKRNYVRAVSSQRCLRAGGKHNDLDNVGYTARHHTFFEMLGNFSFGDYFKRDAIIYAWEFLTSPTWLALEKDKLWITVYATDDEAFSIWHNEVGVPAERIIRIGDNKGAPYASDNFWQMGDTGPCGPCSEIFYDHGEHIWGGLPGSAEEDGDRYIEIWNNVFMQFNRDANGTLHPLPKPSVDTGMGLERISAVLQHVNSNYEIDLFQHLIQAAAHATHCTDLNSNLLKVIADHIRACSFLILDGVLPANLGSGYVLRRIIRRALGKGYLLGQKQAFFYTLVPALVEVMGEAYPDLAQAAPRIAQVLKAEEEQFAKTLETGMKLLDTALSSEIQHLDGETAFKLYDTYGFPLDMTMDICRERGVTVDTEAYASAMARQKAQSKAGSNFKMDAKVEFTGEETQFLGYTEHSVSATILALYTDNQACSSLQAGEKGIIVLDNSAFYAESGGQVGDTGEISHINGIFSVSDTQKIRNGVVGHHGSVSAGELRIGDVVTASIQIEPRRASARNHSATHLLHAALRKILGESVSQKGSLVTAERTRFDFAHPQPVSAAELKQIETLVNQEIIANHSVHAENMTFDAAVATGAMALFGEKYGDSVRVLSMGDFSTELCGGTHVQHTGDIGLFKILSEGGIAAGIRRIEACTGLHALAIVQEQERILRQTAAAFKAKPEALLQRVEQLQNDSRTQEKEIAKLKAKLASSQSEALLTEAISVGTSHILAVMLEGADSATLRESLDKLKNKLGSSAIVLASQEGGKVLLVASVSADLTSQIKAGELVNIAAQQVGGKGGGRPDVAQAGGTQVENIPAALAAAKAFMLEKLS